MSEFPWGNEALDKQLEMVRSFLSSEAQRSQDYVGLEISRTLESRGKLLRPALVLLSSKLGNNSVGNIIELAAAMEMIHLATLIHDDVIDGALFRRGESALHVRIGGAGAVLAGDWLLARALSIAGRHYDKELFLFLNERIEELCKAEIHQDVSSGKLVVSREEYLQRVDGKTAALLRLPCRVGASVAGVDLPTLNTLDRWALIVGRAFQMDDDALDYQEEQSHLRGNISADLHAGFSTLPLIIAWESGDSGIRKLTRNGIPSSLRKRRQIRKKVIELGAVELAREEAAALYRKARDYTLLLPSTGQQDFDIIISRLLNRSC
ncbi:hypothetical protein S1OALGB6SA_667 [Olavius algarvensis spirochete endosymbiont]|uniref:polyprenyl synthetase family protein n=1 Tax=Olavius algarvensis spirochete endosymbiont TaxID=260710 RepID=UPI000F257279|nr:polyprenyl synthetase family protein [Olavius algarvensis spirochete endosymbiont]VDA99596.1 hypothetical protein S1OALGB6SA_667 [Olavius algarvensis spirochete endosymbiont]